MLKIFLLQVMNKQILPSMSERVTSLLNLNLFSAPNIQVTSAVTPSILTRTVNAPTSAASSCKASNKTKSGKSVKTKNSTNWKSGSVSKAMDRIATCFEGGRYESVESGGQLSLLVVMQPQKSQQQKMQQFQSMQQLQMQPFKQTMQCQM